MFTILITRADNRPQPILTKTITYSDGQYLKTPYDTAYRHDAVTHPVGSLADMAEALMELEQNPYAAVIRGEPIGATENIRRALMDDVERGPATIRPVAGGVQWVMLDLDKIPVASLNLKTNQERLDHLVSQTPECFHNASYYYQWSSSAGIGGWNLLSCHLWFWLAEPWLCSDLHERFQNGDFKSSDVDPSPFTPNQLHYTAAPIFVGCDDPLGDERSGLVMKAVHEVSLPLYRRPITPRPLMTVSQHHQVAPFSRFEDLLNEIGPNYHAPIRKAIAHYCYVVKPEQYDRHWLMEKIQDTVWMAPAGKNSKRDYADARYLNRLIDGAERKFRIGRVF